MPSRAIRAGLQAAVERTFAIDSFVPDSDVGAGEQHGWYGKAERNGAFPGH